MTERYGLGRVVNHDPRSRAFPAPTATAVKSVTWPVYGPRLNQGQTSSCTGNAMAAWLNGKPAHAARSRYMVEEDALRLYSRATALDPFPGTYMHPAQNGNSGDDSGSDGNSVCKAAREESLITSWTHAFGFDHMLASLQLGPVLAGTNWYDGFFRPSPAGYIDVSGENVGGHEYLIHGVNLRGQYLWATNSWGSGWGPLNGRFKIPFQIMRRLLGEQGDITAPTK